MILNEYIKSTKHLLCPLYVKMFNIILDTGIRYHAIGMVGGYNSATL